MTNTYIITAITISTKKVMFTNCYTIIKCIRMKYALRLLLPTATFLEPVVKNIIFAKPNDVLPPPVVNSTKL